MAGPVEQPGKRPAREALRLGHLGGDSGELLRADPLDLGRSEGRVADDVREQVQRRPEIGREGGQRDRRPVQAGAGRDGRSEPLLRLGELDRIEMGGAFLEQVQHHRLSAEPAGRIGGDAGVELDRDSGHRNDVAADIDHLDAVREAGPLGRREIEPDVGADRRHRSAGAGRGRSRGRAGGLLGPVEARRRERPVARLRRRVVARTLVRRVGAGAARGVALAGDARGLLIGLARARIDPDGEHRTG